MPYKIDIHTHVFHEKIARKAVLKLIEHYKLETSYSGTAADLQEKMKEAGIDKAVVLCAATKGNQVVAVNNWAIALKEKYKCFVPFGTLHTDFPDWKEELDRLLAHDIKGLKFHPDFQGIDMDDPVLYEMLEEISGRFTVLFHVGDKVPPEKNFSSPQKLAKILKNFPKLEVVAAHFGGYSHWQWVVENLKGYDFYMDTSSSLKYISDPLLHDILNAFPKERFLFGSDYPLGNPAEETELVKKRLNFSEDELEKLFQRGAELTGFQN